MKKILLFGGTGLIGSELLQLLLQDPEIHVVAFTRQLIEVKNSSAAFTNLLVNFDTIEDAATNITGDIVFCCLGTTLRKAKSQAAFKNIDHTLVLRIARIAAANHVKKFMVISSIGAHAASSNFYLKTKGEMERDLQALPFNQLTILRPSVLVGKRKEFRLLERAGIALASFISPLMIGSLRKYKPIAARTVAKAMIRFSEQEDKPIIYESSAIQQAGG